MSITEAYQARRVRRLRPGAGAAGYLLRDKGRDAAAEKPGKPIIADTVAIEAFPPEADGLVLQYFGDIRRFALLGREEERALWQRIERARIRIRRALYTSPLALTVLSRLWRQVQKGQLSIHHVVLTDVLSPPDPHVQSAHLEQALRQLQALAPHLRQLPRCSRTAPRPARQQRTMRQQRVRMWQQWIAIWEALPLHADVYDAMHFALEVAYHAQPDDPALQAAYHAWERAQRVLDQAKAQMLRANLRLVVHVAKRYRHRGVPLLDLIQEGNIGLMRALDKFEPHRGLKFITYAHWWVRQTMSRAIVEQHSVVRLPSYLVDRRSKLRSAYAKLAQTYSRIPNAQELSTTLGWALHEVEALQDVEPTLVRLHESVTDDGRKLEETMEDERSLPPDLLVADLELRQRVLQSLAHLPEREARLLRLRFGLETDQPHSLQEIGTLFGLSRERIRQLEKMALEKLRHSASGAVLADFVDVAS